MQLFRRSMALLLALVFLLMPLAPAIAGSRYPDPDTMTATRARSVSEYMRRYTDGWHNAGLAWTVLHSDGASQLYSSLLCVQPQPGITAYDIALSPPTMGVWHKGAIQPPAVPPHPGGVEDPYDPMWRRWREVEAAVGSLGPPSEAVAWPAPEPVIVTVKVRNGSLWTDDFTPGRPVEGYPNCLNMGVGAGQHVGPETRILAPEPEYRNMYAETAERWREAVIAYPPLTVTVDQSWDGMPAHRTVLYAVGRQEQDYKVTLKADTTAFEPGVPFNLYLKVDHTLKYPQCPEDFGISLPPWWTVKDDQGAEEELVDLPNEQWRNLWWTVALQPGKPMERWITVVPGDPPPWTTGVKLWGGGYIEPWAIPKPDNASLVLPLATDEQPARAAAALPERRTPGDNLPDRICQSGVVTKQSNPERIKLTAEPPVLRSQDGFTTRITARLVDLPGKPAAKGAPVSLEASSIGKLTDVHAEGTVTTATLSIDPNDALEKSEVLITATGADGSRNLLIVPVGGLWLMGQVMNRPGDGTESPIGGATVTAREADGDRVYTATTEANGWYMVRLKEARRMNVSVEAAGYLPADLPKPVDPPGDDDTAKAPALYLVSRDALELARQRAAQIRTFHAALLPGDSALTQAVTPFSPAVPDPTEPGGQIDQWLTLVETDRTPPPDREEALRRLNLALEITLTAGRDAKTFADEWTAALWDDGIGGVLDLLKAFKGLGAVMGKQTDVAADPSNIADALNLQILPKTSLVEEKLHGLIQSVILTVVERFGGTRAYFPPPEKVGELVKYLTEKVGDQARKEIDRNWRSDDPNQKLAIDAATGKLTEGMSREIKELISDWWAQGYLEMINTELAVAVARAAKGSPGGFAEGGYLAAQIETRYRMATLNATRNGVGSTPADEWWKTFIDGSLKDLRGWGYTAINLVTVGRSAPLLDKVDLGFDFANVLLHKSQRFMKGLYLFEQTLNPNSNWWKAAESGIRIAFDAKVEGGIAALPAPAAKSVGFKAGEASMLVAGESRAIDAAPFVTEGRTMVPVRAAKEALGADLAWDPATQTVTMTREGRTVVMTIGKPEAAVSGETRLIDPNNAAVVPVLKDGRTFVPIRFLADALGAELKWDPETNAITLTVP